LNILIATDAWHPQINGVVRTLDTTARTLRDLGHRVRVVSPADFGKLPNPLYPEISLALPWPHRVDALIRSFRPDCLHIATEGPIGHVFRRHCRVRGWNFTTSYHTKFPEYLQTLAGVPERWPYRILRWFHNGASAVMVSTPSLEGDLKARGFTAPLRRWSRGVDLNQFQPQPKGPSEFPRPILLYVGRVSAEKGLEDFLKLNVPGTKVVVGDGPSKEELTRRYPDAKFLGYRRGADLATAYAAADLFVFPSRTDTFGIVMIEAMACGLPVAAYPVTGPIDIVTRPELGALDDDLGRAVERALAFGDPKACAAEARRYTWENSTDQFLSNLVPVRSGRGGNLFGPESHSVSE
jgi:glycosyltransferase involved in cell wall biosynthesis